MEVNIIKVILAHYPAAQAIYLYGSYGTVDEWPDSDVDLALLLAPEDAKTAGYLTLTDLHLELERLLLKDVDLINLRLVPTVLQKEIVFAERRIYCADEYAADEFEMLVMSYYQRLNRDRKEILAEFERTKRAYPV